MFWGWQAGRQVEQAGTVSAAVTPACWVIHPGTARPAPFCGSGTQPCLSQAMGPLSLVLVGRVLLEGHSLALQLESCGFEVDALRNFTWQWNARDLEIKTGACHRRPGATHSAGGSLPVVWVGTVYLATRSSPGLGGSPFDGSLASSASALVASPVALSGTGCWGAQGGCFLRWGGPTQNIFPALSEK